MMSRGAVVASSMSQTVLAWGFRPSGVLTVPSTQCSTPWSDVLGVGDLIVGAVVAQGCGEHLPSLLIEPEAEEEGGFASSIGMV